MKHLKTALRFFPILVLTLFITSSCQNKDTKYTLLEKDDFKEVLKEIHLIDAAIAVHNNFDVRIYPIEEEYYTIFDKYGINKEDFYYNFIYYHKSKELNGIYDNMIQEMTVEKVKLEKQAEHEVSTITEEEDSTHQAKLRSLRQKHKKDK